MAGYAGGFPLNRPLMPAPDAPHHRCAGRPLPLRTSCLVLAGRSPGLEEPPLYNPVRPPFPLLGLSVPPFSHFLWSFLSFISSLSLFTTQLPVRSCIIFLLFPF
uniref:Uncharacterized protein n=1 Tax=Gasterosteus aculeatus TaxID=69293 RepID=G3NWM4_GASAC